ncbi:hypothetical protein GGR21_000709 [Dysgonomonas hofstadii]|uniref:Uncharacterized protein n=1 Tax=Dysgonomonas hofstadii TaxID=637886 RepID=A0A840CQH9_9BACT|nr:hypothetical protein [Dysgonomonas hofstadii]MBB4034822.1 hypothetical protein [Dysgonomonas hofstadii]
MFFDLLKEVYKQINDLRQKGIKMKDIANHIDMPSSVVSAIYSTVLPAYLNNLEKLGKNEALDYAISQVNNVSKKRLLASITDIHTRLSSFIPHISTPGKGTFINSLDKFSKKSDDIALSYLGSYDSYSLSSARDALKKEPFILENGEMGQINVVRKNAYNSLNSGIAIVIHGYSMYIMLNESDESQLALVTIYLQLPFYENVKFLRGMYMTLDYNRNPIARRILFVKNESPIDIESLTGRIIEKDEIDNHLKVYYDYVSGSSDVIKMCSIPFPQFNQDDLITEKKILLSIK